MITEEQVNSFKSLFRGREDVFALRWEKDNKSGYMPAYFFDPYRFRVHKINGGTFQNYSEKTYLKLTNEQISKHLNGEQLIGLYPLLPDNTSWFIAADFDKENWIEECRLLLDTCKNKSIPAYLERSRSGKGGHVWIFFEQPYPAIKSRNILISILQEINIISPFDKVSSFDRLFPNQYFLSGKGLGNLIALPFYKKTFEQGNSCFIDANTLIPIENQWQYLSNIKKIPLSLLEDLFNQLQLNRKVAIPTEIDSFVITLNNTIELTRNTVPIAVINFLKEELNFANTEFFVKKNSGRSTHGSARFFKFIEEEGNKVIMPKGFIGKLLRFCIENKIASELQDERKKHSDIHFSFQAQLREHQNLAVDATKKKNFGVIVSPPGSGKTVMSLKIIAEKQQPALIVVHRTHLATQWIERIESFLGIPKNDLGKIGQGKAIIGKKITIATIQSLAVEIGKDGGKAILNAFGIIIIDECHHIPALIYRTTISRFNCFYLYGLTATPFRKYNDGKLIFIHLGEIIADIKAKSISSFKEPKIIVRNTLSDIPFNCKTDKFEVLSQILIHDTVRNNQILEDIITELGKGNKVVVITERKEHIDTLNHYLKQKFEVVTLCGEDSENSRSLKWKILNQGNYQAVITTGQFFGEGTDLQNANCLFLVYPFSFEGKLVQYIGRVQRSEIAPTIYDYRDSKIDYLNKLFLKRNVYYRKLIKQVTLFDDPTEEVVPNKKVVIVDKTIKVQIEQLEFGYGIIVFHNEVSELNQKITFEIENREIRPELDVLKPYFMKVLKTKSINVKVHIEIEDNLVVAQSTSSIDLDKINNELIEGIRFQFVNKLALSNPNSIIPNQAKNDITQMQDNHPLYNTTNELLEDLLKNRNNKHKMQIQYLADNHLNQILKLRFVLSPFSFVFLLEGTLQFHIILETLDTEEATYLWHLDKNKKDLQTKLNEIDKQLNIIREKGRQSFLETIQSGFSRINHDYSDEKKGFVIWKSLLVEQLF